MGKTVVTYPKLLDETDFYMALDMSLLIDEIKVTSQERNFKFEKLIKVFLIMQVCFEFRIVLKIFVAAMVMQRFSIEFFRKFISYVTLNIIA